MIRIAEKKLIIEIDTFNQHPLAALDDLKNGFVHLLSTVPYAIEGGVDSDNVAKGMHCISRLLQAIMLSPDQSSIISKDLSETKIAEFNKWCR